MKKREPNCLKCNDTGIDPHCSDSDGMWISGYCDCKTGDERCEREICFECGERKEDCIYPL